MIKSVIQLCMLLIFVVTSSFGQDIRVKNIDFQVLVPSGDAQVKGYQYRALASRIKTLFANSVSFSNQSSFYIRPQIRILTSHTAGEVQDVKVLKVELSFTLENPDLDLTFSSFKKDVIVTAESTDLAIKKAIQELRATDKNLQLFVQNGEQSIRDFYTANCAKIIQSSQVRIARKEYASAFSLLQYVPEELACSKDVENMITSIYQAYKDEYCAKQLHRAQSLTATEAYSTALEALRYIDPRASCHGDVATLLQQIGEKVNQESMDAFAMEKLKFEKHAEMEKMRILIRAVDEVNLHIQS